MDQGQAGTGAPHQVKPPQAGCARQARRRGSGKPGSRAESVGQLAAGHERAQAAVAACCREAQCADQEWSNRRHARGGLRPRLGARSSGGYAVCGSGDGRCAAAHLAGGSRGEPARGSKGGGDPWSVVAHGPFYHLQSLESAFFNKL